MTELKWRRATAAKDEPVVHRALAVNDHVPMLTEGLSVAQTDLVPERLRQGCGGHDQRVDRCHGPSVTGQPGGPCLGGPDDVAGLYDDAVGRLQPAVAQAGHPSVLADPGTLVLDGAGKSHCESEWMDAGTVRVEGGAPQSLNRKSIGRGCAVEPGRPCAPVVGVLLLCPTPKRLRAVTGNDQRPTLVEPALDAFRFGHPADLVDAVPQCGALIPGDGLTVAGCQRSWPHGVPG